MNLMAYQNWEDAPNHELLMGIAARAELASQLNQAILRDQCLLTEDRLLLLLKTLRFSEQRLESKRPICRLEDEMWKGGLEERAENGEDAQIINMDDGEPSPISVDLISDFACPWVLFIPAHQCYVGKMRFDKAVTEWEGITGQKVTVRCFPYMIDTRTKTEGEEYMAYNVRRWGGDGWTHSLRSSGRKDGCLFANWVWWPNTLNAHQLLLFARPHNKQSEVSSTLFRMEYEEGKNISTKEEVIEACQQAGLPVEDFRKFIGSKEAIAQVKKEDSDSKNQGIGGVPYFVIRCGKKASALEGAQETRTFLKVFSKLAGAQKILKTLKE